MQGTTAANAHWTVTVLSANTFTLNGSTWNAPYVAKIGGWTADVVVGTIDNKGTFAAQITAGDFITDQLGNPLKVAVVDAFHNPVITDNTDVISIGVAATDSRGPYFLGQGTDPTRVIYPGDASGATPTMNSYATAKVVNGIATFSGAQAMYQPVVGAPASSSRRAPTLLPTRSPPAPTRSTSYPAR